MTAAEKESPHDRPPPLTAKLIGASLGPGDPELITRRAWAALQSGARWLYPVKKGRGIVVRAVDRRARRPAVPATPNS
jgi:precorrin-2 methylase